MSAASECDTAPNDSPALAAEAASSERSGDRLAVDASAAAPAEAECAVRACGDAMDAERGNGNSGTSEVLLLVCKGSGFAPVTAADGSGNKKAEFSARSMRSAARKCDWCKIRIEGLICG